MTKDGTEAATHTLKVVRPARAKTPNFVEIQPPANVHDVQPFFEAAAGLYPNVNLKSTGIRVVSLDEFKDGDLTPEIMEDLAADSIRWHHLVTNILPSAKAVYVVPAYVCSSDSCDRSIYADSIKTCRKT